MFAAVIAAAPALSAEPAAADPDEPDLTPQPLDLVTVDGVQLAVTYYPGSKGKDSVPVILLHGLKGSQKDYAKLAPLLQKDGHAVLVPDLRGHGDSTTQRGAAAPLNPANFAMRDFGLMVTADMERIRAFLIEKNNAGELNIEKTCLVGAEMGASVALTWSYMDWLRAPVGNKKQGQDVKAVVAISPEVTPGLPLRNVTGGRPLVTLVYDPQLRRAFKEPDTIDFRGPVALDFRREASFLLLVGKKSPKSLRETKNLHRILKTFHPDPPEAQRATKTDLFYGEFDTNLQGTNLFKANLNLEHFISKFIDLRLAKRSYPWAERVDPYGG